MKKYQDLSATEKQKAIESFYQHILSAIVKGEIRFDKIGPSRPELQARIDRAFAKAEKMKTPWFVGGYITDDVDLVREIRGMAQADAEVYSYAEYGELVAQGICDPPKVKASRR